MGRKYGHTVDALRGNPLCICDEHVIYRPWKSLTRPTKWGRMRREIGALKVGKSFEIADYPHSQTEISKLRCGIGANRLSRLIRFTVRRLSGTTGVRITKIGTWESRNTGG